MKLVRFFVVAIAVTVLLALVSGCTTRTAQTPDGRVLYKSTRFGNKEAIRRVEYRGPDGSLFIMEGFTSDQVESLGVVAEATARGTVQGLTGGAAVPMGGLNLGQFKIPEGMKAVQKQGSVVLVPKDDPSAPQLEIPDVGGFVAPPAGARTLKNFPQPGQPVLMWDGKSITTNIYNP